MPAEDGPNSRDEGLSDDRRNQQQAAIAVNGERARAWIRYCVEYRERRTNDLINKYDTESFGTESQNLDNGLDGPVFDLVTTYKIRELDSKDSTNTNASRAPPAVPYTTPSYHIHIRSHAIINALRSVVQYYPEHDLSGDSLDVKWPYPILVHHYDELTKFREDCAKMKRSDLCVREKDVDEHLGLLLQFLDEHVMEDVNREKERNKKGLQTFEWTWISNKPGTTKMERTIEDRNWKTSVVHSIEGGIFNNPPTRWLFTSWKFCYDGTFLRRVKLITATLSFDGEREISEYGRFINCDEELTDNNLADEEVAKKVKYGELYWQLLQEQCKYHKGKTVAFPYNEVCII